MEKLSLKEVIDENMKNPEFAEAFEKELVINETALMKKAVTHEREQDFVGS